MNFTERLVSRDGQPFGVQGRYVSVLAPGVKSVMSMRKADASSDAQPIRKSLAEHVREHWNGLRDALSALPKWERPVHVFWLLGPFILLLERTPADIWLSLIALIFAGRSIWKRQGWWLRSFWVRAAFLFWAACLVAAAASPLPAYSLGETFVWFRFPLFAMAVAFWLGRDRRFVYAMLASICAGMLVMCAINAAEMVLVGQVSGRLSWPYGDLVPGNYLAKACLPAFLVAVALATSARSRVAGVAAVIAFISILASLMTGERINFLIRACGGMLAAFAWKPKFGRVAALLAVEGLAVIAALVATPGLLWRFFTHFVSEIPVHGESIYFRAMAPGVLAFKESPLLGIGPGNLRYLCGDVTGGSAAYDCHPHPHNYYIQMMGEAGIAGLVTGLLFCGSIIWACARPAIRDRSNVVVATMWIVPFGFFWPIASSADFFGQWNNLFMWSALAVALAGAQIGSQNSHASKG